MWSAPRGAGQVYDLHQHVYALRTKLDKEYSPFRDASACARAPACTHSPRDDDTPTCTSRRAIAGTHVTHTRLTHCVCMRACMRVSECVHPRTRRYAAHELCRAELQKLRVLTGAGMDA